MLPAALCPQWVRVHRSIGGRLPCHLNLECHGLHSNEVTTILHRTVPTKMSYQIWTWKTTSIFLVSTDGRFRECSIFTLIIESGMVPTQTKNPGKQGSIFQSRKVREVLLRLEKLGTLPKIVGKSEKKNILEIEK